MIRLRDILNSSDSLNLWLICFHSDVLLSIIYLFIIILKYTQGTLPVAAGALEILIKENDLAQLPVSLPISRRSQYESRVNLISLQGLETA